jgi:glutaredoxin 3
MAAYIFLPTEKDIPMAEVEIYATPICPYCTRAKRLLSEKGVSYVEIDVMQEPRRRSEMVTRAGGRNTVPQIFIGGTHVGGSDDLYALEREGKLDGLLNPAA